MACSSNCTTGPHESYGACLRAKNIRHGDLMNGNVQKAADKNLDEYAKARSYGIQPKTTNPGDVQRAIRTSEKTGTAYQA